MTGDKPLWGLSTLRPRPSLFRGPLSPHFPHHGSCVLNQGADVGTVGLGGCCVSPVLISPVFTSRQRFSPMHTTTPIFHGWGLARFFAARFGPASGGGVGLIQGRLPIGGFAWVHGVSLDFWRWGGGLCYFLSDVRGNSSQSKNLVKASPLQSLFFLIHLLLQDSVLFSHFL
jgi:hypothetical protein